MSALDAFAAGFWFTAGALGFVVCAIAAGFAVLAFAGYAMKLRRRGG